MAIYINGVEMPKDDDYTILTVYSDGVVYLRQYKGRMCLEDSTNATSIPEPHGRLIDERVAYDKIAEQETGYYMDMDGVDRGLQDTPTVIEGSE